MTTLPDEVLALGERMLSALNTDQFELLDAHSNDYLQMLDELFGHRELSQSLSPELTAVLQQYARIIERVSTMRDAASGELQRVTQLDRVASFYRKHSG